MSIAQDLLDLLNYFTCPISSHWEEHESDVIMLLATLPTERDGKPSRLDYEASLAVQQIPEFADFSSSLKAIQESVDNARAKHAAVLGAIRDKVRGISDQAKAQRGNLEQWYKRAHLLERAWNHFYGFASYFTALDSMLDLQLVNEKSLEQLLEEPGNGVRLYTIGGMIRDEMNEVFQALLQMIRAKDAAFNRRAARFAAAERLGSRTSSGKKPAREDWESVRRDVAESLGMALEIVNGYLKAENADFRMSMGYVHIGFDDEGTWRRAQRRDPFELQSLAWKRPTVGESLTGIGRTLVLPFLDYLVDPAAPVRLAVCENPQCGCVFVRSAVAENKRFCTDPCRRDVS